MAVCLSVSRLTSHYCQSIDDMYIGSRVDHLVIHYMEHVKGYDLKKKYIYEVIHYALHKVMEVDVMTLIEKCSKGFLGYQRLKMCKFNQ